MLLKRFIIKYINILHVYWFIAPRVPLFVWTAASV